MDCDIKNTVVVATSSSKMSCLCLVFGRRGGFGQGTSGGGRTGMGGGCASPWLSLFSAQAGCATCNGFSMHVRGVVDKPGRCGAPRILPCWTVAWAWARGRFEGLRDELRVGGSCTACSTSKEFKVRQDLLLISTRSGMMWLQGTFPRILCCGNHRGNTMLGANGVFTPQPRRD